MPSKYNGDGTICPGTTWSPPLNDGQRHRMQPVPGTVPMIMAESDTLRECRMIMPKAHIGHSAHSMSALHGELVQRLIALYGGVTAQDAEGYWVDPSDGALVREPVLVYDVAIDTSYPLAWNNFSRLAVDFAGRMRQKSAYVRDWRGRVFILPT